MQKLVVGLLVFGVGVVVAGETEATSNPYQYYDWNSYQLTEGQVLAAESPVSQAASGTEEYKDYQQHKYLLGFVEEAKPGDPFYFLKRAEEAWALTFTFDPARKEEVRLGLAGERLAELQELVGSGKLTEVERLVDGYQKTVGELAVNLGELTKKGRGEGEVVNLAEIMAAKHLLVLEEIALQAPEAAEAGMKTALWASERVMDVVADVEGRPAVPQEVVQRLQALKAQGILSEEETAKIIGANSREQARVEMRKYTQDRVIPEADYKKLDEPVRENFPGEYFRVLEVRKFRELKDLETQKPDEQTLKRVQEFVKDYKTGEVVPPDLRRWYVPLVRLEELQNTFRPDLVPAELLRNRPEDYQKYQEVVERIKPTEKDVKYVESLVSQNPNLINDPAYGRILALANKFGSHQEGEQTNQPRQQCSGSTHWVTVPFMPNGGYCVPNYDFPAQAGENADKPCLGGYHRISPGSACYADDPGRVGTGGGTLPAPGSCPGGYNWVIGSAGVAKGYCAPASVTDGGPYPNPISVPGYCLPGQVFRDGKCERYNPAPPAGCPNNSWWNGSKCIEQKNCEPGYYQDNNGECRKTSDHPMCVQPPGGCGFNSVWDQTRCSCRSTFEPFPTGGGGPYPTGGSGMTRENQEAACKSGGGTCNWQGDICNCQGYTYQTPSYPTPGPGGGSPWPTVPWPTGGGGNYQTPYGSPSGGGSGSTNCGSGYYWNGSYCAPSSGGGTNYQAPAYQSPTTESGGSGSYGTPSYSYPSPNYLTPATNYATPSYGTPAYNTPTYNTPAYGTPSYGTPEYSTPTYGTPSYGTPEYSTPTYGTPENPPPPQQ